MLSSPASVLSSSQTVLQRQGQRPEGSLHPEGSLRPDPIPSTETSPMAPVQSGSDKLAGALKAYHLRFGNQANPQKETLKSLLELSEEVMAGTAEAVEFNAGGGRDGLDVVMKMTNGTLVAIQDVRKADDSGFDSTITITRPGQAAEPSMLLQGDVGTRTMIVVRSSFLYPALAEAMNGEDVAQMDEATRAMLAQMVADALLEIMNQIRDLRRDLG